MLFDTDTFEKMLATSWLGRSFFYFEELDSTSSHAKKMNRDQRLHGALIVADDQLKGRGQYDRSWKTEPACNLTFSLIFEPHDEGRIPILSLACALAATEVFEEAAGKKFQLKWPNDIYCDEKKVGGILTETLFNGNELHRIILGMGLNINQQNFGDELQGLATSLIKITGEKLSRESVLRSILMRIEYLYRLWVNQNVALIQSINKKLIGYGKWVDLEVNKEVLPEKYKFLGINENGALLVLNKDLEVDTFSYEQVRIHSDH